MSWAGHASGGCEFSMGANLMESLLPFLIPIFSQLLQSCGGQQTDPQAAIKARRNADGTYDAKLVRQSRPKTRRAMRLANKGKHRTDTTYQVIDQDSIDANTVAFFDHVLKQTQPACRAAYRTGLATVLGDEE